MYVYSEKNGGYIFSELEFRREMNKNVNCENFKKSFIRIRIEDVGSRKEEDVFNWIWKVEVREVF